MAGACSSKYICDKRTCVHVPRPDPIPTDDRPAYYYDTGRGEKPLLRPLNFQEECSAPEYLPSPVSRRGERTFVQTFLSEIAKPLDFCWRPLMSPISTRPYEPYDASRNWKWVNERDFPEGLPPGCLPHPEYLPPTREIEEPPPFFPLATREIDEPPPYVPSPVSRCRGLRLSKPLACSPSYLQYESTFDKWRTDWWVNYPKGLPHSEYLPPTREIEEPPPFFRPATREIEEPPKFYPPAVGDPFLNDPPYEMYLRKPMPSETRDVYRNYGLLWMQRRLFYNEELGKYVQAPEIPEDKRTYGMICCGRHVVKNFPPKPEDKRTYGMTCCGRHVVKDFPPKPEDEKWERFFPRR